MTEPAKPKRKRARKARPSAGGKPQYTTAEVRRIYRNIEKQAAPRVYSQIARQCGNPAARPRDFKCLCPPCVDDGQPICAHIIENCPHGAHARPGRRPCPPKQISAVVNDRTANMKRKKPA